VLESRDQLDSADDSYDLLGTDDRQLRHTPPIHLCDNIVNRGIFFNTNRLWGHDCRNAKRTHSLARGPALLDPEERLKPVYGRRIDAQLVAMQEISLRNDPYETSIIVQNGKASLIGLQQQARGVDERRVRFHGCKRGSHNVRREHGLRPPPVTAFSFPMFD
jgi:hypothetical protein